MPLDIAIRHKDLPAEEAESIDVDFGAIRVVGQHLKTVITPLQASLHNPAGIENVSIGEGGGEVRLIQGAAPAESVQGAKRIVVGWIVRVVHAHEKIVIVAAADVPLARYLIVALGEWEVTRVVIKEAGYGRVIAGNEDRAALTRQAHQCRIARSLQEIE